MKTRRKNPQPTNMADLAPCVSGCQRQNGRRVGWCTACTERRNATSRNLYLERVSRGQCPYCTQAAKVGIFCFDHWFKNVGSPHGLGSKKGAALLKELWEEQQGRCAVTGKTLQPGSTASIDHIIPKSRGGTSDKSNLRWVLLRINQCKWDMTHEEFIEMCQEVARVHQAREAPKVSIPEKTRSN